MIQFKHILTSLITASLVEKRLQSDAIQAEESGQPRIDGFAEPNFGSTFDRRDKNSPMFAYGEFFTFPKGTKSKVSSKARDLDRSKFVRSAATFVLPTALCHASFRVQSSWPCSWPRVTWQHRLRFESVKSEQAWSRLSTSLVILAKLYTYSIGLSKIRCGNRIDRQTLFTAGPYPLTRSCSKTSVCVSRGLEFTDL